MIISLIVAMGRNKVIGRNNSLPWYLPADMKRFKEITTGKPVIMGRKTFESIKKPLPNRINIIVTHDVNYKAEGCMIAHSVEEALKAAEGKDEVMVIGGSKIYEQFLPIANKIYLTVIDEDFDGDTFFPEYKKEDWKEVSREEHKEDEQNWYDYVYITSEKNK